MGIWCPQTFFKLRQEQPEITWPSPLFRPDIFGMGNASESLCNMGIQNVHICDTLRKESQQTTETTGHRIIILKCRPTLLACAGGMTAVSDGPGKPSIVALPLVVSSARFSLSEVSHLLSEPSRRPRACCRDLRSQLGISQNRGTPFIPQIEQHQNPLKSDPQKGFPSCFDKESQ